MGAIPFLLQIIEQNSIIKPVDKKSSKSKKSTKQKLENLPIVSIYSKMVEKTINCGWCCCSLVKVRIINHNFVY